MAQVNTFDRFIMKDNQLAPIDPLHADTIPEKPSNGTEKTINGNVYIASKYGDKV